MRTAGPAIAGGLRRVARSWGLCLFLLGINLATALLLAVPLAVTLAEDFHERPSGPSMMRGFDYPWWSHWSDTRSGWQATLGPDLLGKGFGLKNLDLLLKGQLPAGVFAMRDAEGKRQRLLDPLLLGIAAAYMLVQIFLAGGVLSVLRQAQGRWTMRGMLHGAAFYSGRFLRIWALMMVGAAILFAVYGPLARWADAQAREAVSEATAEAWLLGRHVALLVALVFLHVVGTYARVITVLEERSSAALAVLSALAFALTHLLATVAVAGGMAILFVLALALWQVFDQAWTTIGYRTQIVTLLVMQALVLARIVLRVALAGALMDLHRRHTAGDTPAPTAA
jgi:hypothetical protein